MNPLNRIWNDIRRGENIDLYLTFVIAIGLVVTNLTGFASDRLIPPITLAILGLLAITLLGNRYRIEELLQRNSEAKEGGFLEEFPPTLITNFESASELWLVGVSLVRTIKSNYQRIERKLRQGIKVKVLLVHPDGPGVEIAVSRNYSHREPAQKISEIKTTLEYLTTLQQVAPYALEIRTIQNPLSYGAIAINPESASGILYLENYCFRISSEALPKFIIRTQDGKWYDFYKREIQNLWEAGVEWRETRPDNRTK